VNVRLVLAVVVLLACVVALTKRREPRIALLTAGVALASIAGTPLIALDAFVRAMVAPMVAPICASMGFAFVLSATGCDRALVATVAKQLRRFPRIALPGAVVAAFLVNLAAPSQSGAAAMAGPLLVPLLTACGHAPLTAAAAVLLGASFGADLLQPGAQDIQSVAGSCAADAVRMHAILIRALPIGLAAAACALALQHRRGALQSRDAAAEQSMAPDAPSLAGWRNSAMALTPLVPIALILLAHAGVPWLQWLLDAPNGDAWRPYAGALPIVRAMLIGSALAAIAAHASPKQAATHFFAGMGRAYADVISLTIAASVFGAGIAACGIGALAVAHISDPASLCAISVLSPFGMAALSGSGSGPILAHAQAMLAPMAAGPTLDRCAALSCLGGAFGRTASPAAAVVAVAAGLAQRSPTECVRAIVVPLAVGAAAAITVAMFA
jgi:DcuC family C4-dicarboxylate transporter